MGPRTSSSLVDVDARTRPRATMARGSRARWCMLTWWTPPHRDSRQYRSSPRLRLGSSSARSTTSRGRRTAANVSMRSTSAAPVWKSTCRGASRASSSSAGRRP
eukprot:7369335-Prymnesium_polylepis.1